MAKKKKKLELTWLHYLPGVQFTNAINTPMPSIGHPELEPLDIPVPNTPYVFGTGISSGSNSG